MTLVEWNSVLKCACDLRIRLWDYGIISNFFVRKSEYVEVKLVDRNGDVFASYKEDIPSQGYDTHLSVLYRLYYSIVDKEVKGK